MRMRDPNPKSDKGEPQDGGEGRLHRDSYMSDQVGGRGSQSKVGNQSLGWEAFSR